jgi:uncharacterized protein YPO0396
MSKLENKVEPVSQFVNRVVPASQFAIVNKVAAMLNLGDYGKVEHFITKVVTKLGREVDNLETSVKNERHILKGKLSKEQENLQDAKETLEETYLNIDPKALKTNADQRAAIEPYLDAINSAEITVKTVEDAIEALTEASNETVKDLKEEIQVRKDRISLITVK